MRITALWHDFRTPLCGFQLSSLSRAQNSGNLSASSLHSPPPGLCTPGPGKLVRARGGYIGSLSIPTEQKVNDVRLTVDSEKKRKKKFVEQKIASKKNNMS